MPKQQVHTPTVNGMRTICEVHREIYDILIDEYPNEQVLELLNESFVMAKKMNLKLRQYKNNYDDGWWEKSRKKIINEKLKRRQNNV